LEISNAPTPPNTGDLFESEANNFVRFALIQGDGHRTMAADHALSIKTPTKLAGKFGARTKLPRFAREYE
jgi:hypothetical protein